MPLFALPLRILLLLPRVIVPFWFFALFLLSLAGHALAVMAQMSVTSARHNLFFALLALSCAFYTPILSAPPSGLGAENPMLNTVAYQLGSDLMGGHIFLGKQDTIYSPS